MFSFGSKLRWDVINSLARRCYSSTETIVIPKRIHRRPTDILRALESTIQRDYTAPEYKYHDDPYLIPASTSAKRSFAMSREAGRKAALWIRKEHAEWFSTKIAEPPIKALTAKAAITEESDVDENTLKNLIGDASVSDAITVYGILQKKGQTISDEVQQAFLELLCYYNCSDTIPEELLEERWFRQSSQRKQRPWKTWKDDGLAETVFKSLSSGPYAGQAHRALVKGMARHGQAERAWQLFKDMTSSGDSAMAPDAGCFSALISVVPSLREGAEGRWQMVETLLREMASMELQPNISTLNSVLEVITVMGMYPKAKELALQTLAEFNHLGVQPCLASYYHVLNIFCKERGPVSNILIDILNKLEGKPIVVRDSKDTLFFVAAMENCRFHLQDVDLAHRVHNLLLSHNNYDLIGDSYKESVYYRNYFTLMCIMEPLESFMEFYNKLVPNVYVPEPTVMEEILRAIDLNGAMQLLPQMWSDMIIFDQTGRESLLTSLLDIMVRNPITVTPEEPEESRTQKENLRTSYMHIAWGIWDKVEEETENVGRSRNLIWTGSMLGDLLSICVQCGAFDKAWKVLVRLGAEDRLRVSKDDESHPSSLISGIPSLKSLLLFIDACIEHNDASKGISCVKYAAEAGYPETGELGRKLLQGLTLNQMQMDLLSSIIGVVNLSDSLGRKSAAE